MFCTGRVQKSFVIRDCGARFRGLQIGVIRGFGCYGRAPASWDWGDGVPRPPLHLWRRGCSRLPRASVARRGTFRPFSPALLFGLRVGSFFWLHLKSLSEVSEEKHKIESRSPSKGQPSRPGGHTPAARNMGHFHGAPVLTGHGGHCVRESPYTSPFVPPGPLSWSGSTMETPTFRQPPEEGGPRNVGRRVGGKGRPSP